MLDWNNLSQPQRKSALQRPFMAEDGELKAAVRTIIDTIIDSGDRALQQYTRRFDSEKAISLQVTKAEIQAAVENIEPQVREAIDTAYEQIRIFHEAQASEDITVESIPGVRCTLLVRPLKKVGLYVPGGSTPLPSTALMLGVPAQLAGCPDVLLFSPPQPNGQIAPAILYAAGKCGISRIYGAGGAQAIAAMAYGTETVPAVDKIFGPGNRYVTAAKQIVSQAGQVAIDMPAGPSEVLVIADKTADPDLVAIDLLSQAEHGPDSQVILVSPDRELIRKTEIKVSQLARRMERREILEESLKHARYILCQSLEQAVEISNDYAPEHLILQAADPDGLVDDIDNAGSIFLGAWTPESAGDYASGTNHVLPTYGAARYTGSLGLADFQKRSTVQKLSSDGLRKLGNTIMDLARTEGLEAHRLAVSMRLEKIKR